MIQRIDITGYKSIKDQSIKLSPINVLIGGNGIGKSNFISAFSLINSLYEQRLQSYIIERGGADTFLYMGRKMTDRIKLDIYFGERNQEAINRFIASLKIAENRLYVESLSTAFNNGIWHEREYERDVDESSFKHYNWGQAYFVNELIQALKIYHFHDTGNQSPMKALCRVDDNHSLRRDGANIAAFLYYLQQKHPKHFYRIERTVCSVAPFFEGFNLMPNRLNESTIQLEWKQKGAEDVYFNAYQLSDGTLRFICLTTLLLQPEPPRSIIIDEPELGLHPMAINKLAALIKSVSLQSQVIITTQSVTLVDNFAPEDIIVVDQSHYATTFSRMSTEELTAWLEDYSLGEIWEKNIIGGQPWAK